MTPFPAPAQALYDMLTQDMKQAAAKMEATRTEPAPHLNAQRAYNDARTARDQLCLAVDPEGYAAMEHDNALAADDYLRTPSR